MEHAALLKDELEIIKKYYNDLKTGFVSANKLFYKLKEEGHKVKIYSIKKYINSFGVEVDSQ